MSRIIGHEERIERYYRRMAIPLSCHLAIRRNQRRQHRYNRAETLLRWCRLNVFEIDDYDAENGTRRAEKLQSLMATCQAILAPKWRSERAAREDRMFQATPSRFECGGTGR